MEANIDFQRDEQQRRARGYSIRTFKNTQKMGDMIIPFLIVCRQTQLSLKVANTLDSFNSKVIACQPNINDLSQLWFLTKSREDHDEITNAATGLVMEVQDGMIYLRRGKLKQPQLFFLSKYRNLKDLNDNSYIIKPSKGSTQALCQYGGLIVREYIVNHDSFIFQFTLADNSIPIVSSSILSNQNSRFVIDIPQSSFDANKGLIQYHLHGKLNQRWIFVPLQENRFKIRSLNNGLVIDSLGSKIVQNIQSDAKSQIWIVQKEQDGFSFMSCFSPKLYMGISGDSQNITAELELVDQSFRSRIWKVFGKEPQL